MLTQHQRGDDHQPRTLHLLPHDLFHHLLLCLTLPLHLPLSWPLCLSLPLPHTPTSPPHKWPISPQVHCVHSNLCGRANGGDVQWPFLVFLAERAMLHANGFWGCCLTLRFPSTPNTGDQGHTIGHYLCQTSVTHWNLFLMASQRQAIHFWRC